MITILHYKPDLCFFCLIFLIGGCLSPGTTHGQEGDSVEAAGNISFKKHILTDEFVAEGAAVGDVNQDGKVDVLAGPYWFEAPQWEKHALAQPEKFFYDKGYSNAFISQAMDVNLDGWVDFVRIGFPGKEAVWFENPKKKKEHWKVHIIHPAIGNESAGFYDVDGDGRLDLLGADSDSRQIIWLRAPVTKGSVAWEKFTISKENAPGTHQFSHGIGLGDVNDDRRPDVVIKEGWWEAPADVRKPDWNFHTADLGEDAAQMYVYDLEDDGDKDVISSSAHKYGIWWHEQIKDEQDSTRWTTHLITKAFSQTHGLEFTDMNSDGLPDLVTGKRYFAHQGHDPGGHEPAVLYWFEFKQGKEPAWIPHQIDDASGVGVHVVTEDITKDGLIDIIVANKKGVFVFEQEKQ